MARPLESEADGLPDDAPLRGEIIGRVVPRTTLRPATDGRGAASDEELATLLRRTDPRTEGDAPSIERVRTSAVDAVGTAADAPEDAGREAQPEARARAIVAELQKCGPGDERAHLEPLRHLGRIGVAVLVEGFPGLLWFDRRLPHRKTPRGRDASPVCSLLVGLGDAAAPFVRALLEDTESSVRYYAALVAADLGAPSVIAPLARRAFDEDADVREVAVAGLAALARDVEERPSSGHAVSRALEEAAAYVRLKLGAPACTPFERISALAAVRASRDRSALALLAPYVAWIERDVAETAREALRLITAEDFGADVGAWQKWIRKNGDKTRAEWLVAALGGARTEQRAYAHSELVRLLGADFGYSVDMGPIDRLVAQRRASKMARERGHLG